MNNVNHIRTFYLLHAYILSSKISLPASLKTRNHWGFKQSVVLSTRELQIRNRNVYFSPKRSIREQQIASRRVWEAQPSVSKSIAAQDVLPDELKAAIILFFSLLDERERRVYAGLESLKLGYGGDRQMAEILGLDVSTVARGRRELLEHDVNVERVRKAGAGRKAVEKKRQKSSRRSKNL